MSELFPEPRIKFYNRQGELITMEQWARLIEQFDYKVVAQEGINGWLVSTVWLGVDHGMGMREGPPLIFETMVFPKEVWMDEYCERWSTEAMALWAHGEVAAMVRRGLPPSDLTLNDWVPDWTEASAPWE